MPYLVTNMTQQKISYNLVEIHVYEFVFFFRENAKMYFVN